MPSRFLMTFILGDSIGLLERARLDKDIATIDCFDIDKMLNIAELKAIWSRMTETAAHR